MLSVCIAYSDSTRGCLINNLSAIVFYEATLLNLPIGETLILSIPRNWTFLQNRGPQYMVIKRFGTCSNTNLSVTVIQRHRNYNARTRGREERFGIRPGKAEGLLSGDDTDVSMVRA